MDDKELRNSDSSTERLEEDETLDQDLDDESGEGKGEQDSSKKQGRSAKDRIDDLSYQLEERNKRIAELESKVTEKTPMPPTTNTESSPEAQKVITQLESLGFTRKGAVEEQIKQIESRIELNAEHARLTGEYDGSDGRPRYDKSKIERFMKDRAIYDPEIAYKAMHEAELLDWNLKKSDAGSKKRPYVERPGGGGVSRSSDSQITRDKLQEVQKNPSPANREWYERNRNKILQMLANGEL